MVQELKAWHVLMIILGFFGITIGVNAVFVTYAISTFAGEDVQQPYLKGLQHNKVLKAHETQAQLGWTASAAIERSSGNSATVKIQILDGQKQPLSALSARVLLRHPMNAHLDRTIELNPIGEGRYSALVDNIKPGQWDLVLRAESESEAPFEAKRRVILQ